MFGNFQKHVTGSRYIKIPPDARILDIGGNIGAMALQYAQIAPEGKIISFEPTHYAVQKFKRNLALNPALNNRIELEQCFISSKSDRQPLIKAFSSWKVDGTKEEKHPVHLGTAKPTEGVPAYTLDDYCQNREELKHIDFIKIDTDGHEYEVFKGAYKTIARYRPQIIFEVGQYVMKEKSIDFEFYYEYFTNLNYALYDTKKCKAIDMTNRKQLIPSLGTTDIIAIPKEIDDK